MWEREEGQGDEEKNDWDVRLGGGNGEERGGDGAGDGYGGHGMIEWRYILLV